MCVSQALEWGGCPGLGNPSLPSALCTHSQGKGGGGGVLGRRTSLHRTLVLDGSAGQIGQRWRLRLGGVVGSRCQEARGIWRGN